MIRTLLTGGPKRNVVYDDFLWFASVSQIFTGLVNNDKVAKNIFWTGAGGPRLIRNFGEVAVNGTSPKFPMRWGPPAPVQKIFFTTLSLEVFCLKTWSTVGHWIVLFFRKTDLFKARVKRGPSLFHWSIGRGITTIRGLHQGSTLERCLTLTKLGWSDLVEGPQVLTFRFFKLATRGLRLFSDWSAKMALRAPKSVQMGWYLAELVLKGIRRVHAADFEMSHQGAMFI